MEEKWYKESVRVFDGDFTVDSDKKALVDTVLGLWAHALGQVAIAIIISGITTVIISSVAPSSSPSPSS